MATHRSGCCGAGPGPCAAVPGSRPSMIIRVYEPGDLEALGRLHALSRRHAYAGLLPPEAIERIDATEMTAGWVRRFATTDRTYAVLVAEVAGGLAGFCMVTLEDDETAVLNAIHVHPDYHGSGMAPRLHDEAVAVMRAWGCGSAYLWVLVGNDRAQAFYRRHGWVADGTRGSQSIGGVDAPILRYALAL
jgi:GNAT superfamily N-acetyltransferase